MDRVAVPWDQDKQQVPVPCAGVGVTERTPGSEDRPPRNKYLADIPTSAVFGDIIPFLCAEDFVSRKQQNFFLSVFFFFLFQSFSPPLPRIRFFM